MDREFLDDDEPFFRFDNEDEEAAAMDQILDDGDLDADPMTPFGSVDPTASSAAVHVDDGPGRLHLSSAQIWQSPDRNPENASPPPLTYSPSPRTTSSFKHRHQDPSRSRRHHRFSSSHNSSHQHQHQPQTSRHDAAPASNQDLNGLSSPISDLSLHQQYVDSQQTSDGSRHHRRPREKEARHVSARARPAYEEHLEERIPLQDPSYVPNSQQSVPGSRSEYNDPDLAAPQDLHHHNDRIPQPLSSAIREPQRSVPSNDFLDHESTDIRLVTPEDCQDYELIPADEVHEMMYNGDEESRITAQKFKEQIVHAVTQNGKVCYMVLQATAQWWRSPEMNKRKRAAGRKLYDVSSQVVSGAGQVIMTSTPVGRICDSVSANVTAFKAAPLTYTMQGLGVMKRTSEGASALPSAGIARSKAPQDSTVLGLGEKPGPGPIIADDDGFGSEFDEDACLGLDMFDE